MRLCGVALILAVGLIGVAPLAAQGRRPPHPGEMPPLDPVPERARYVVERGDTLTRIAQKFIDHYHYPFINDEWIAVNAILDPARGGNPNRIFPGDVLEVPNLARVRRVRELLRRPLEPWADAFITVHRDQKTLAIENRKTGEVRTFPIGIGSTETPTPTGSFTIWELLSDPVFRRKDDSRVVISRLKDGQTIPMRWPPLRSLGMQIDEELRYRIHSTTDPNTVGGENSNGCIRLHIDDALELSQIVPDPKTTGIRTPGVIVK